MVNFALHQAAGPRSEEVTDVTLLDALARASGQEAAALFARVPALDLVTAVTTTSDTDLLALIGREEVRAAAVPGILDRLDEYAVPEQLARVAGVARFDLRRRTVLLESHAVRFSPAGIERLDDPRLAASADVVLTTSVLRFVRLVSGERNAGLEFLAGTLDIDGDADLALAIGALFRVPGQESVAVDPTALDPADVAAAVDSASVEHLRKVLAGGFRPVVLGEVFRRLPEFVNATRARNLRLTIGFRLTGAESGDIDRYVVHLADGRATVTAGEAGGEDRDATITCAAHDFLRLATGNLSAVTGVLRGQLKVRGDRARALQFSSVVDFPSARSATAR